METADINLVEPRKLVTVYNQLSIRAFTEKDYRKAKEYLFMALEAIPEYEYNSLQNLQVLQQTGTIYYGEKNYDSAKYYFEKSIDILYIIRNTLAYDEKMKFLASNTSLFNQLALCNYQLGNKEGVFKAMEESKSLVLLEKLAGKNENKITIERLQEKMKDDEVYLMTYFSKSADIFSGKIIMAISKESTAIELLSDSALLFNAARQPVSPYMDTIFNGFKKLWTGKPDISLSSLRRSSTLILAVYLQTELAKATASSRGLKIGEQKETESHANNARILGSVFYEAMIKPFEKLLTDKKKIIIIPDGQLSFVPFETLVDEKGKYLTETYNISYLPSIKVAELLLKRQSTYKGSKVALIGNPVYNELSETDMQIGVRPAYRSADAFSWTSLPETKTEIDSIRKFYTLSTTLSDVNCTEEKFKALFTNPADKYSLIHFATHGHVMDKDAGLSSVVLNQVPGKKKEDGYLTSSEIEAMKIPAQLVVLSACQTGKGLLMEGEGVQGLSSSFLVAGANSLIVSLWSVADKSTSLFMQEVYKLVNKEGLTFKAAIQKVKQLFLAGKFGEEFRKPFYWAPFIYIGN
jgi:CHAT domain-containing protein